MARRRYNLLWYQPCKERRALDARASTPHIPVAFLPFAMRMRQKQHNTTTKPEVNVTVKDQLLLAGELGRAAFYAGKICLPAKDKDFMRFLRACDNRRVGTAAAGEAPSLALLMAWMRCWQTEQQRAAALPAAHVAAPSLSRAVHASQ